MARCIILVFHFVFHQWNANTFPIRLLLSGNITMECHIMAQPCWWEGTGGSCTPPLEQGVQVSSDDKLCTHLHEHLYSVFPEQ